MNMSSLTNIVLFVFLLAMLDLSSTQEKRLNAVQYPALARLIKMRCTRRFSPGVCVEEVTPVWTFVVLAQNCTERLGCPNNYRTNRFRSYRMCMKRCRSLVNMYLQMVELEDGDENSTKQIVEKEAELREGFKKNATVTGGKQEKMPSKLNDVDLEDEDYKEDEQGTHMIVYKDMNVNEDILPPDVDYVGGQIRSEFDFLH